MTPFSRSNKPSAARCCTNTSAHSAMERRLRASKPRRHSPGPRSARLGRAVGDLFGRIRISMPQDKPGSLGRQQAAEVVAYILSFNKAPAGPTELPADADALKTITIKAAQ